MVATIELGKQYTGAETAQEPEPCSQSGHRFSSRARPPQQHPPSVTDFAAKV